MSLPFTHAIVDEDNTVIRKFRWSAKEAKWHKEQGKKIIKLVEEKLKHEKENSYDELIKLCGAAPF